MAADPPGSAFAPYQRRPDDTQKPRTPTERREADIRRLEALQGLMERMAGAPLPSIAAKYAVSLDIPPGTTGLTDDRRTEILDALELQMLTELGPLVIAVYEANMKMGSLEAARDIGLTLGILKKPTAAKTTAVQVNLNPAVPQPPPEIPVNSIDDYRLARQTRSYKGKAVRSIDLSGPDDGPPGRKPS